jgi:hypothetical protein
VSGLRWLLRHRLFGNVALCRSGWVSWAAIVPAPLVAGLFKWRQFEPKVILLAVGWYLRFSLSYRDVEEPWRRGLAPITSRWGDGCVPEWNDVSSATQNQPTIVGAWTKLVCALKATGCTCTGSWTQRCDDQFPSLGQTRYSGGWALLIHICINCLTLCIERIKSIPRPDNGVLIKRGRIIRTRESRQ